MALLGKFQEGVDGVRLHMRATKPVNPASVFASIIFSGEVTATPLAMVPETDSDGIPDNEYVNTPDIDLTGKPTGIARIDYGATDFAMNQAVRSDTIRVTSGYGRNYGQDYGNGL